MRRAPSRASSSSVSQVSPACREGVSMDSLSMGGVSFPPPPAGCLRVRSRERIRRLFSSTQVTPSTTFENNSTEWVVALFPAAGAPVIRVAEEVESDTKACHRITVSVMLDNSFDARTFARLAFQLHRQFAEVLSQDELQAIRLIVEPRSLPAR